VASLGLLATEAADEESVDAVEIAQDNKLRNIRNNWLTMFLFHT